MVSHAPPRKVHFNLNSLLAPPVRNEAENEQRKPLVHAVNFETWSGDYARYIDSMPIEQLPESLRFGKLDGCTPFFRASWVRAALMKLGITGIIAALVAGYTPNREAAWSCALAASVNAVACVHYWLICVHTTRATKN